MISLLQRVTHAEVAVDGQLIGKIGAGILALIGVERGDTEVQADRLLARMLAYRIFNDDEGRMNLCLGDVKGELLLVPQFTLAADTRKGLRPGFSAAAQPHEGARLFGYLLHQAREYPGKVASGRFGADMQVSLTNDGPVTFWLQIPPGEVPP